MKPGAVKSSGPGLRAILAQLHTLDGVQVTAGLQGTAKTTASGDSTPAEIVTIGIVNEKDRPFMRTTTARHGKKWIPGWDKAVAIVASGKSAGSWPVVQTLKLVGLQMVGDVQATLNTGPWKANSEATKAAKGSDQPLVDTGQLKQSIRAQVEVPGNPPAVVG
jgi:hypothetical protein